MTTLDEAASGVDADIRPQDDLYGHVNGRWLLTTEIPADRATWGAFVVLVDEVEARVRAIVEECTSRDGTDSDIGKIGDLYASFLDEDRVEQRGAEPLRDDLAEVAEASSTAELARILGRLERQGVDGMFNSYVSTDDRNSDRYLVNLAQGGLGLPDESYYREERFAAIRKAYLAHLERMFQLAGQPAAEPAARQVFDLESRLARGHWDRAETREVLKTYNLSQLSELVATAPAFDFAGWTVGMQAPPGVLDEVVVRQPSYLAHLSRLLEEVPLSSWKAWLASRVIRAAAPYLSSPVVAENFDFYGRTLNGTPELRARWKRGVSLVESALGEAVGRRYVERHFPPASKALMDSLVNNLVQAYRRSIAELDWMGQDTKARAFAKLDTFRPKIGYPEKFRDYSAWSIDSEDLLGNARRAAAFEHDRQLDKIGSPVDRDEWFMLPQTVNAYYNPGTNEICFPAGILQKPFFDPCADAAENYGGIGAVIGHEIGHGFDDQGSRYDDAGNLQEWWTEQDRARFGQRSAALVKQYDGFSPRDLPGEHVNGALTVGENIGDLGGLTVALRAYLLSLGGMPQPVVNGRTGIQRVFLSWAYVWRSKRRLEQQRQYLAIDPHAPPEFRANVVRNLDEFHEAFATRPGDGLWLDPEERVRIW